MKNNEFGFVYVLENACMPEIVKIGVTDNIHERLRVLYNTSVPLPFKAVYACKVRKEDMRKIESALHKAFAPDRVNPRREFFRMDADRAVGILSLFHVENVTDEVNEEIRSMLEPSEILASESEVEKAASRRPSLNFHRLGIGNGEHLYYKDDSNVFVTVCSERKVVYNGEICSLTAATMKVRGISYGIQPTPFWLYNGRPLIDIYNDCNTPTDESEC